MNYTTSSLAIGALAPFLVTAYPANTTVYSRDDHPKCSIGFNSHRCKDFNTEENFSFSAGGNGAGMAYLPHPSLPQALGSVSHCFDFVEPDPAHQNAKDPHAKPTYGKYGRTILESDKRPLFTYPALQGHMWMFDDGCKKDFGAIAVFESSGCQGSYFWYDLNKMTTTTEPAVTHADPKKSLGGTGQAWRVAPFNPTMG